MFTASHLSELGYRGEIAVSTQPGQSRVRRRNHDVISNCNSAANYTLHFGQLAQLCVNHAMYFSKSVTVVDQGNLPLCT